MNPDEFKRPQVPTAQGKADSLWRLREMAGIPEAVNPMVTAPPNPVLTTSELEDAIRQIQERQARESLAAVNAMAATSAASYADAAEELRKMGEAMGRVAPVVGQYNTDGEWNPEDGVGDVSLDQAIERIMNEINGAWIIGPEDVIKVGREMLTRLTNEITDAIRRAQDAGEQ